MSRCRRQKIANLIYVICPHCKIRAYVHNYKLSSRIRTGKKKNKGHQYGRCGMCLTPYTKIS